ncbi:hypothetical protein [Amycolatopsis taiwanensis]|uniref:Uncharacterized protein n=1 Tax=Amycolatopsis taiwanensis TaxID=342230 RepID=A0A9W6QWI3_9PSEU|nr:hypothetical protein [Amycolatopsis taiwanensis]GLY63946.1 hypothetical protein Atai01_05650 [Amycolatopsis taiwanensis]
MGEVAHMAGMGLMTSVVAPGLVLVGRRFVPWRRLPAPPVLVLPLFLALHSTLTVAMGRTDFPVPADLALHTLLLAAAVWFWLPVLQPRPGRPEAVRAVYLFLAGPSLDLAAVYLIIAGEERAGLAMIIGMLPLGLAAVVVMWRWIVREDRLAERGRWGHGADA